MSLIRFAKFDVTSQVFYKTAYSFALVNLKPLLPGHVLVCPLNVKPRISDLSKDEFDDLFRTVRRVEHTLNRLYKADACNIAIQDGKAAGQSVPHVHCHIIPRKENDEGGEDKVHEWLEGEEGNIGQHQRHKGEWQKDEDRRARSLEEMEEEAQWLASEMAKDDATKL